MNKISSSQPNQILVSDTESINTDGLISNSFEDTRLKNVSPDDHNMNPYKYSNGFLLRGSIKNPLQSPIKVVERVLITPPKDLSLK
jgi:hypothetical protein